MEGRRNDGGLPAEHQRCMKQPPVRLTDGASLPDDNQKVVSENGGRKRERKGNGGVEKVLAAEGTVGENVGEIDSRCQRDRRRDPGYTQAEPQR